MDEVPREQREQKRIMGFFSSMVQQVEFTLQASPRGFHLISDEVLRHLPQLPKTGLLNLFVQHTSCALSICENWDPDVRGDMETIYDRLVPAKEG